MVENLAAASTGFSAGAFCSVTLVFNLTSAKLFLSAAQDGS